MAEERTLRLARAQQDADEEPSKEDLQRRLGEARHSITNTVTEIKETVANQVQAVKDSLDWREQFKKRPVVWSAGAAGAGFALGYCIAAFVRDEESAPESAIDRFGEEAKSYASQSLVASGAMMPSPGMQAKQGNGTHDSGPGFFQKVAGTHAFGRVRDEAGTIGDAFVQELSKTARTVVLPALITSLRNFIGDHLPNAATGDKTSTPPDRARAATSAYQPSLEHNQS